MKKALLTLMCLAIMMAGIDLKAQEVTIVLNPGWTWISYPSTDTVDFATVFGPFTPAIGDIIKSKQGSATYIGDGQWRGTVSQLYPGNGYHYKSNRNEPVMVTFNVQQSNPQGNDHVYVDLGLPSGLLWATCNVGANSPEEYGDYFAWGETQPKDIYNWTTYQYCNGSNNTLTKYCNNSNYGYNNFTDNLICLLPEDDAATANWGNDWRMPTKEEWQELYNYTTCTWTTQNGVNGKLFTATNGNSIFLPAVGYRIEGNLSLVGSGARYWSSSLRIDLPYCAAGFYFDTDISHTLLYYTRICGHPVRPVRSMAQNIVPIGAINGRFSVGVNQQVYFSQGNLQYQPSTHTWRFAENQYDYIGSTNRNISSLYNGWIDLFGWGTSGYNHGAVCYQPWSTTQTNSSYYAYGNYSYNLNDQIGKADWGYNPISNGGNTANQWCTLSIQEWNYVFFDRATISGIRYAKANVNNVNGVILLPDDWSGSTYSLNNTNNYDASYSSNTIDVFQWATLENEGAVFLPAAGFRGGSDIYSVGSGGLYWSTSCKNTYNAYLLNFSNGSLGTNSISSRDYGRSVRLVQYY